MRKKKKERNKKRSVVFRKTFGRLVTLLVRNATILRMYVYVNDISNIMQALPYEIGIQNNCKRFSL